MKKLIFSAATISVLFTAFVSCKKETISNPISSTKIGEEGLDRIPMI